MNEQQNAIFELQEDYRLTLDSILTCLETARLTKNWELVDDILDTFALPFTAENGDCEPALSNGVTR